MSNKFYDIVFIVTSGEESSRFIKGITILIAGLTAGAAGIYLFREGVPISPEAVKSKILRLAAKKHGEVPEEIIMGKIGNNNAVDSQLNSMINSGIVKKIIKNGRTFYIFSEFNV